ncbi:MAG: ElaA protein [Micromonosporaceae bacterium]
MTVPDRKQTVLTGPHVAAFNELDTVTLYGLLRLRVDVFVVEQRCPYPELDGKDLEPGTQHLWLEDAGTPSAYLRLLRQPDGLARIGRVCVAEKLRGTGAAKLLMRSALDLIGSQPSTLDAQAYLVGFYAGFGYAASGPEYMDDGIPHVPMERAVTENRQGNELTSSATDRRRPV